MESFFIIAIWFVFLLLAIYTFFSWYKPLLTREEEIDSALEDTPKKKVKRVLNLRRTFYNSKDSMMLHPLVIEGKEYVARVTTQADNKVTEVDAQVINIFLVVYSLTVININFQGGEEA